MKRGAAKVTASPPATPSASPEPVAGEAAPPRHFEIAQGRTALREHTNVDWTCVVPSWVRAEALHLRFEPYASIAGLLTRGDAVLAVTEDDSWIFELRCVIGDRGRLATCAVVKSIEVPTIDPEQEDLLPAGYAIRPANSGDAADGFPPGSWIAYRIADGALMSTSHYMQREECRQMLLKHAAVRREDPHGNVARYG